MPINAVACWLKLRINLCFVSFDQEWIQTWWVWSWELGNAYWWSFAVSTLCFKLFLGVIIPVQVDFSPFLTVVPAWGTNSYLFVPGKLKNCQIQMRKLQAPRSNLARKKMLVPTRKILRTKLRKNLKTRLTIFIQHCFFVRIKSTNLLIDQYLLCNSVLGWLVICTLFIMLVVNFFVLFLSRARWNT